MNKVVLYFKAGINSNTNARVFEQLKKQFSKYEIIQIDVIDLVASNKVYVFFNYFYFLWEYGIDFLLFRKSRWTWQDWFFVTSYMFKKIKFSVQQYKEKYNIIFTFQTGSRYDACLEGIPHFVYTDSTVLANLSYPDINIKSVLKSKAWMRLEPQVYKNAVLNFMFSENQVQSLLEQYRINQNKVKCIYAGSNASFIESVEKKDYSKKNILFVGVNWERKGGVVLAKAFDIVLEKIPDAKLIIIGVSEKIVKHYSPSIALENCVIKGKLPADEVEQYYNDATVFCMPTRIEPFGIVFIEAMHRKLPIVASNIGAIPEFVKHEVTGYTFHPNDVQGIAKALVEILENLTLAREMGEQGASLVKHKYTWDNTGLLLKGYIEEALRL